MFWQIIKKEFHQNIITSRFIIGTMLCIIFMIAVKITLLDEQKMMIDAYNRKSTENENNFKKFYVYSTITTEALKPPEPLAIFHEGVSKKLGGVITITRQEVPYESSRYVLDNPFLGIFQSIDVVLIFKLVMSLLALLFAFDMFSGEKENGTLKLVLSTRLSRAQLFMGKYFGGLLSLTAALFPSFIIGLLILLFAPFIKLTLDMFTRIFLIYFISIIFTASFFSIGALISCTTHRSVVSLAISLFIWVVLVIALPNLGDYIGSQLKKVEQSRIVADRVTAIDQEFRQVLKDYREKNPSPKDWVVSGILNMNAARFKLQIATKNIMDYLEHFIPFCEKEMREYSNRAFQERKKYLDNLLLQAKIVNYFTIFSPVRIYENLTKIIARTDVVSHLEYLDETRIYRDQMLQYFEDKDVYHQYRFSTIMERGEAPDISFDVFDKESERAKIWGATREKINYETREHLDLDDFPRFHYQPVMLSESLYRGLPFFTGLIIFNLVFILITYYCFVRYDVR